MRVLVSAVALVLAFEQASQRAGSALAFTLPARTPQAGLRQQRAPVSLVQRWAEADAEAEAEAEGASEGADAAADKAEGKDKVDDILNTPIFLKRKLEVLEREAGELKEQLDTVKAQTADGEDDWQEKIDRLNKEFEMLRERARGEMGEASTNAKVEVLKEVLTVTDNFVRAKATVDTSSPSAGAVVERYDAVYDNIQAVFEELGMTSITTVGEPFDPNFMEAVMQQPSDEFEEGSVLQEYQAGFVVGDKTVRPAFVVVSAG
uniref:GrpE protein homolog n=1 Tax=Phaeomonas parva TaxID=124430 RepID=A0A7S1UFZ6_9STRA|mmetsp:Transcript_45945/g.143787  ORF Transcript_45945/g.143787 Transcript_45945/m.143787 type:complete len:262 (+) Transcript_45945:151-936(+)